MKSVDECISPKEFVNNVNRIIDEHEGDHEMIHMDMDYLMEEVLKSYGYDEGVEIIRNLVRWYA